MLHAAKAQAASNAQEKDMAGGNRVKQKGAFHLGCPKSWQDLPHIWGIRVANRNATTCLSTDTCSDAESASPVML